MPKFDLNEVDQIIREVAATEIMPRFRNLAEGDIEMKGVNDPVSIADKESERHLTLRFKDYLPDSLVVGEESFAKDKAIMAHLDKEHPVWVIDPIDGTRNFVAGVAEFAVMVALVKNRKTIAAWIHDPNSKDTIMAERGAGAWLRGKKMKLAANDIAPDTAGLVGARIKKLISDPAVMPQSTNMPKIEIGSCAGFDYPRLFTSADGDGTVFADAKTTRASFLLYRHTNAWDHIPGLFLHEEGGGYNADWSGKPYDMTHPRAGLLYAPDKGAWERLYRWFEPLMAHAAQKAP